MEINMAQQYHFLIEEKNIKQQQPVTIFKAKQRRSSCFLFSDSKNDLISNFHP